MITTWRLTCRRCPAGPEQQRDVVSLNAVAYTCSQCLVERLEPAETSDQGPTKGVEAEPSPVPAERCFGPRSWRARFATPRLQKARQRARGGRPKSQDRSRFGRFRDRHPEYRLLERDRPGAARCGCGARRPEVVGRRAFQSEHHFPRRARDSNLPNRRVCRSHLNLSREHLFSGKSPGKHRIDPAAPVTCPSLSGRLLYSKSRLQKDG